MKEWTIRQQENYLIKEWATYAEIDHPDYKTVIDRVQTNP